MKMMALLLTFVTVLAVPADGLPSRPPGTTLAADAKPDAEKVEPAAVELAMRAEAGDAAYVAKFMEKAADADAVADMVGRIRRADVRKTFGEHLEGRGADVAGLNYHEPSHFQVELRKGAGGTWEVARLRVCR